MASPEEDQRFRNAWAIVIVIIGFAMVAATLTWTSWEQGIGILGLGIGIAAVLAAAIAPGRATSRQPSSRPLMTTGILVSLVGIVLVLHARALAPLWVLLGVAIVCAGVLAVFGGVTRRREA